MATVVLKTTAGVDFTLASGKVVSLNGNSVLNRVNDSVLKELMANERFSKKVDLGFIVVGASNNEKVTEDLQQDISNSQTEKQKGNESKNNVKLEKQSA
jgi:hypothetical protein